MPLPLPFGFETPVAHHSIRSKLDPVVRELPLRALVLSLGHAGRRAVRFQQLEFPAIPGVANRGLSAVPLDPDRGFAVCRAEPGVLQLGVGGVERFGGARSPEDSPPDLPAGAFEIESRSNLMVI